MSRRNVPDHLPEDLAERPAFQDIYADRSFQLERWRRLFEQFQKLFGPGEPRSFSSPGRVELCGNHTDHSGGLVLAGAVTLDSIAVAAPNGTRCVTIYADSYDKPFVVDLADLRPQRNEIAHSSALIRGIASRFSELGYSIGGFDACITSDVLVGSGMSSSASIEVLIAEIFNALSNASTIDPITLAKIAQFAENNFFGKPCGLMDQIACAVGGIVMIDFHDNGSPCVKHISSNFPDSGHVLVVVNTGGSHADLTDEYAAIPREMTAVAEALGKRRLIDVSLEELLVDLPLVRAAAGDRAIERAIHFFHENERVAVQVEAIEASDFRTFFQIVNGSGDSSWTLLQNCFGKNDPREQGVALALSLTRDFLRKVSSGACRVHGGGFAGTIQAWVPMDAVDDYKKLIEPVFGPNSIVTPSIRSRGVCEI